MATARSRRLTLAFGRRGRPGDRGGPRGLWLLLPVPRGTRRRGPSAGFMPRPRPAWQRSRLPDGAASLSYPPGWRAIRSDPGTVTAALRSPSGEIRGYLNATPKQGDETLAELGALQARAQR